MFFFILVIVGFVLFSIWKDGRQKRDVVFTTAAKKLDLNLSIDGIVFRKHWLSGIKGKFRVDAGAYGDVHSGQQRPHMGYRITFRDPITLDGAELEASRSRLIAGFPGLYQECEVDREGIFFARADVPADGAVVVSDIERLIREAEKLLAKGNETLESGVFVVPVPESAREIRREIAGAPALPPPLPERTTKADANPAATTAIPATAAAVFEPDEPESEPTNSPETTEVLTTPFTEDPDEATTLDLALLDLFSAGRNRYETGKRFESDHRGKEVEGRGTLRNVDRYSHDRVFGRGPGRIALVEVRLAASDGADPLSATLCAELLDDEASPGLIGKKVDLAGTLIGCDPFTSRIYLTASTLK